MKIYHSTMFMGLPPTICLGGEIPEGKILGFAGHCDPKEIFAGFKRGEYGQDADDYVDITPSKDGELARKVLVLDTDA